MSSGTGVALTRRRLLVLFVVGLASMACSDAELTYGGPLALTVLSSNAPVAQADSLVVEYDIDGGSLLGLAIEWGDMTVDSVLLSGAQSAEVRRAHLYAAPGSYTVTATVDDVFQGSASQEITVTVNP